MKNHLRVTAALVAGAIFASVAMAATLTFTWENATEYEDGSAIMADGPDALRDTVIEYGVCNGNRTAIAEVVDTITVPASTLSSVRDQIPSGVWCARARHVTNAGTQGLWTNIASVDKAPAVPKAPTNFSGG